MESAVAPENKPKLYLETTIPSFLTAKLSPNVIIQSRQIITHAWWRVRLQDFSVYVSALVLEEAARGDINAASRRLKLIENIECLPLTEEARHLAKAYMTFMPNLKNAQADAAHLAIAVTNKMDFLMTWNCKHINAASVRHGLKEYNRAYGLTTPIIGTPEELYYALQ